MLNTNRIIFPKYAFWRCISQQKLTMIFTILLFPKPTYTVLYFNSLLCWYFASPLLIGIILTFSHWQGKLPV